MIPQKFVEILKKKLGEPPYQVEDHKIWFNWAAFTFRPDYDLIEENLIELVDALQEISTHYPHNYYIPCKSKFDLPKSKVIYTHPWKKTYLTKNNNVVRRFNNALITSHLEDLR